MCGISMCGILSYIYTSCIKIKPPVKKIFTDRKVKSKCVNKGAIWKQRFKIVKLKKSIRESRRQRRHRKIILFLFYSDSQTTIFFKQAFVENVLQKLVVQRQK